MSKPRKAYRPRANAANAVELAMRNVSRLTSEEVERACFSLEDAFTLFGLEKREQAKQWSVMVDAMNLSEALADQKICSDDDSRDTISNAQQALARLHRQHHVLGSWAMWDDDRRALILGIELHRIQLSQCNYSEYSKAVDAVVRRTRGALAGTVSAGVTVLSLPKEANHA